MALAGAYSQIVFHDSIATTTLPILYVYLRLKLNAHEYMSITYNLYLRGASVIYYFFYPSCARRI